MGFYFFLQVRSFIFYLLNRRILHALSLLAILTLLITDDNNSFLILHY